MVLSCQEDIANVPEKSILHLLRAGSTRSKHLLNLVQNLISVLTAKVMGVSKKISFEAYNESTCLIEAIERFRERTGYYLERVLADQIYRTRETRNYCKEHGIRLSGPKSGRPSATTKVDKKQEYQDNTDRIEVERTLSLIKRCYGMSCITTKLEETQLTSIALSVFVTNLFRIQRRILYALLHLFRFWHDWNRCKSRKLQIDT